MEVYGRKWYFFLRDTKPKNESLESVFGLELLKKKLVVCYQLKYRLYSMFDSASEFMFYARKIPIEDRHFFEVVVTRKQKPHFDVDIPITGDIKDNPNIHKEVLNDLIKSIIYCLKEENINVDPIEEILAFESHGPNKKSYHIIIDGYYHETNIEAGCFYHNVIDMMLPYHSLYIDSSVYKTVQQFRMLGSRKNGTNRIKRFLKRKDYIPKDLFLRSLISYTGKCKVLPSFDTSEEDMNFSTNQPSINIDDQSDLVQKSLNILAGYCGTSYDSSKFPFSLISTKKNLMILKRLFPSFCQRCDRVHEKENPYLYVSNVGNLYFDCRRDSKVNNKILIGKLFTNQDFIDQEYEKLELELDKDLDFSIGLKKGVVNGEKKVKVDEKIKVKVKTKVKTKKEKTEVKTKKEKTEVKTKKEKTKVKTKKEKTKLKKEPEDDQNFLGNLLKFSKQTQMKIKRSKD